MAILGFDQLLVVFSVTIFLFVLLLIALDRRKTKTALEQQKAKVTKTAFKVLYLVHVLLLIIFIAFGLFSIWNSSRSSVYFILLCALFVTSTLLVYWNPKKFASLLPIILLTILSISLFQSLIPLAENSILVFGPDQWTYISGSTSIVQQGTFFEIPVGDLYYSTIPLFSILGSVLTLFTGDVFVASMIITAVSAIVMVLAVYLILFKLSKLHIASILGVFVFLSIPHLSLIEDIPSTMSLVLGALLILLIIDYIKQPTRAQLIAIILLSFSTVIFHPAGIIAIIGLCIGLVLASFLRLVKPSYLQSKTVRGLLVLTFMLSLIYWCSTDPVFVSVVRPINTLVHSIPSAASTGSTIATYQPNYFQSGFEIFSYAWALPVGLGAAYSLTFFVDLIRGKHKRLNIKNVLYFFAFVAGVIGLIAMVIGFVSVINSPSSSVERYVDTPSYLLLLIPTALLSSQLLLSKRRLIPISLIALLLVAVFIGSSSPAWAPFENSSFAAVHYTYIGYEEAQTIAVFLPNNSFAISDHDIGVNAMASLINISLGGTGTYQITRNILNTIKDGSFNESSLSVTTVTDKFYTLRLDEFQNASALGDRLNVLYNSGMHITVSTPKLTQFTQGE